MKTYYKKSSLFFLLILAFTGCKKNNPVNANNNNITIRVQGQVDGRGNYVFSINPNTGISLKAVLASIAAQQYKQTIDVNKQLQAGSFQPCLQYAIDFIQTGMQMTFEFTGTKVNTNQDFNSTSNYRIP